MIEGETFRDKVGRDIAYIQRNCPLFVENLRLIRAAELEKIIGASNMDDVKYTQGAVHTLDILINLMYMPDKPGA